MIQTMSNPNDWLQFYQQNFQNQTLPPSVSDSTAVTTTTSTTTTIAITSSPSASTTHLSPEGRVSKPARRRSRASRRTPTTLLNTDTTNFRAMVQQFTGGPTAPSASSTHGFPSLMGFGLGPRHVPALNPTTTFHLQQLQQHQQQQQNLYQPPNQQQQQYMYSGSTTTQGGGDDTFFQRLIRPPNHDNVVSDVHDGVLMEHGHGHGHGGFFPNTSS